jgi:hypothetical protein
MKRISLSREELILVVNLKTDCRNQRGVGHNTVSPACNACPVEPLCKRVEKFIADTEVK